MKRIDRVIAAMLIGCVSLVCLEGCGPRQRTLTIKVFVDGSDVVKVSGNKLWLEHETFSLPGKTIYVNGQAWTPKWNEKVSGAFEGVNPAFTPRDPQRVQLSKRTGRGEVSIVEMPTSENGRTLAIRLNDDDSGGADWYEIVVSW